MLICLRIPLFSCASDRVQPSTLQTSFWAYRGSSLPLSLIAGMMLVLVGSSPTLAQVPLLQKAGSPDKTQTAPDAPLPKVLPAPAVVPPSSEAKVLPSPSPQLAPLFQPSQPAPSELSAAVLEQRVFQLVNEYRSQRRLPPLRIDTRLSQVAREHSQSMASRRVPFGHPEFRRRVLVVNRVVPSRRVAENVAYIFSHQDTANRAVQGWIRSDDHRPSMEGAYSLTGIGVAQGERGAFYFTQIFVRPR